MKKNEPIHDALLRADLWRIASFCFERPTQDRLEALHSLLGEIMNVFNESETTLSTVLKNLREDIEQADLHAWEKEYHALFTTQVVVSPFEGAYHRTERGAIIGDIAGFYKAFGLQATAHDGPPDALKNELAFMSWLSLKEAYAIRKDMTEELEVTLSAEKKFLEDHVGRWFPVFHAKLVETTGNRIYLAAAHLVDTLITRLCALFIIPEIKPLVYGNLPQEPEVMSCPAAGSCGEIEGL